MQVGLPPPVTKRATPKNHLPDETGERDDAAAPEESTTNKATAHSSCLRCFTKPPRRCRSRCSSGLAMPLNECMDRREK